MTTTVANRGLTDEIVGRVEVGKELGTIGILDGYSEKVLLIVGQLVRTRAVLAQVDHLRDAIVLNHFTVSLVEE